MLVCRQSIPLYSIIIQTKPGTRSSVNNLCIVSSLLVFPLTVFCPFGQSNILATRSNIGNNSYCVHLCHQFKAFSWGWDSQASFKGFFFIQNFLEKSLWRLLSSLWLGIGTFVKHYLKLRFQFNLRKLQLNMKKMRLLLMNNFSFSVFFWSPP